MVLWTIAVANFGLYKFVSDFDPSAAWNLGPRPHADFPEAMQVIQFDIRYNPV